MRCTMCLISVLVTAAALTAPAAEPEHDPFYHQDGPLAGSLKRNAPLPLYDADPQHLWNRVFAAFYIRESNLPRQPGGQPVRRVEGGDLVDLLAWSGTDYWTRPEVFQRVDALLAEFIRDDGARLVAAPLRRAVFQRDLWTVFDFLCLQNIRRRGDKAQRDRRDALCRKLATVIASLALPREQLERLPDNYATAIRCGAFAAEDTPGARTDYLPPRLLTAPQEWAEMEFHQPDIHEDIDGRFITLHTRHYRGRSFFRIFYRFPGGRGQLADYLKYLDAEAVDWKRAAHMGFFFFRPGTRQMPVGVQAALVQFMIGLDDELLPVPTRLIESVRLRTYLNVDGTDEPESNTGAGMNVYEYTLRRRLLFDDLRNGGLTREPDHAAQYRVIFQPRNAPDWGRDRRVALSEQCVTCHMGVRRERVGIHSFASVMNSGGFAAGAMLGIAHPTEAGAASPRPGRAVRWKEQDETYRRLLDYLGK